MQDKEIVKVVYKVTLHGGVVTTAGLVSMSTNIHEVYRVYKQERRDLNDPYAFLEFCSHRYGADIFIVDGRRTRKNIEVFNFSEQVM